jgi:hypothetical protein
MPLNRDVNQLKELHAHQGNPGLKERESNLVFSLNFSQLLGEGLGGSVATEWPTTSAQLHSDEGR